MRCNFCAVVTDGWWLSRKATFLFQENSKQSLALTLQRKTGFTSSAGNLYPFVLWVVVTSRSIKFSLFSFLMLRNSLELCRESCWNPWTSRKLVWQQIFRYLTPTVCPPNKRLAVMTMPYGRLTFMNYTFILLFGVASVFTPSSNKISRTAVRPS